MINLIGKTSVNSCADMPTYILLLVLHMQHTINTFILQYPITILSLSGNSSVISSLNLPDCELFSMFPYHLNNFHQIISITIPVLQFVIDLNVNQRTIKKQERVFALLIRSIV